MNRGNISNGYIKFWWNFSWRLKLVTNSFRISWKFIILNIWSNSSWFLLNFSLGFVLNAGNILNNTIREKCPYSEFFWSVFSDCVSLRIQSECRKIRTRKTPNTDTFHAVTSAKPSRISFYTSGLVSVEAVGGVGALQTTLSLFTEKVQTCYLDITYMCTPRSYWLDASWCARYKSMLE